MTAIVYGWCRYVEKANDVVFQQMVLKKLWIPDVLIDIIKDFLYISADAVLRKYYRIGLNLSITSLYRFNRPGHTQQTKNKKKKLKTIICCRC